MFKGLQVAGLMFIGLATTAGTASAGAFTMDLNCVLNTTPCVATTSSYGTIKLEDAVGGGIKITVDLAGTGQKFIDLMLNYQDAPVSITDNDPDNIVQVMANGFSINPYNGLFDVGDTGQQGGQNPTGTQQGWNGGDPYSVTLMGVGFDLELAKFKVKDSTGGVYAGIHIQNIGSATGGDCTGSATGTNCAPGVTGPGSLKIGATGFTDVPDGTPVPDGGTTLLLLGSALMGLGAVRRLF